jgi:hypothetical protein
MRAVASLWKNVSGSPRRSGRAAGDDKLDQGGISNPNRGLMGDPPSWPAVRVIKVFDAPLVEIIDKTGAVSTPSAKLLRNRRFRFD